MMTSLRFVQLKGDTKQFKMKFIGFKADSKDTAKEGQKSFQSIFLWNIRWGTILTFCLMLLILLAIWSIKYHTQLSHYTP